MTSRVRTALVSVACFAIAFGLVLLVGTVLRSDEVDRAGSDDDALSVDDASGLPYGTESAVRGFVFFDPQTGPLLCSARRDVAGRPACDGTVLRLEDLDPNRIELIQAEEESGGYDAWSDDAVTLLAVKEGPTLRVLDVLR